MSSTVSFSRTSKMTIGYVQQVADGDTGIVELPDAISIRIWEFEVTAMTDDFFQRA
ncbi:hypothetical protein [Burkholderia orbicola]|uniref:hypothetical protein n=1 Tax=Burkholderia orbicola TaxID=2978683 RepID=UPI002FE21F35